MTTGNPILQWLTNHIELPMANLLLKKGDVHCYSLKEVRTLAEQAGLQVEICEKRKGMRLHAVMRKAYEVSE